MSEPLRRPDTNALDACHEGFHHTRGAAPMTATFHCPACRRDVPYAEGCADDAPALCSECWARQRALTAMGRNAGMGAMA